MIQYFFADRDGTLIYDKHYLSDPAQVELIPHTVNALKLLQDKGIKNFVVTNQSGIGRGYFTEKDLFACQNKLEELLLSKGVRLVDYAYCPHAPEENCHCRKPSVGMWEELSAKYRIKPEHCAMIGDKKEDVLFGIQAGFAYSCLVLTGKGQKTAEEYGILLPETLAEFSSSIFGADQKKTKCLISRDMLLFANYLLRQIE